MNVPLPADAIVPELERVLADPDLLFCLNLRDQEPALEQLSARARAFWVAARADSTRDNYARCLREFVQWCRSRGYVPVPTDLDTILYYLADCSRRMGATGLRQRSALINRLNCYFGFGPVANHIAVKDLLVGAQRSQPQPEQRRAPLRVREINAMAAACDREADRGRSARNRAILLLGLHAALRRSELVALDVADLTFDERGVTVFIAKSKTDRKRVGAPIRVSRGAQPQTCPVVALQDWLEVRGMVPGPLFCHCDFTDRKNPRRMRPAMISLIVKHYARGIGLDVDRISSHSMRAGFVTSGYEAELPEGEMMDVTRHNSVDMLRRYKRDTDPWRSNLTQRLGC